MTLTRSCQIAGLGAFLVGAATIVQLTIGYVASDRKAAHRAAAVAQAEMSNGELRDLVAKLQDRLAAATDEAQAMRGRLAVAMAQNGMVRNDLRNMQSRYQVADKTRSDVEAEREAARGRLREAEDALAAKSAQIARMGQSLDGAKTDLKQTEQQRSGMERRVHALENELAAAESQVSELKAAADSAGRKLQQVAAEREKLMAERNVLLGRIELAQEPRVDRAASDKVVLVDPTALDASPPPAPTARPTRGLGFLADETRHGWGELMQVLASAGVDLDSLAARFGAVPTGQGGPFVALKGIKQAGSAAGDGIPDGVKKMLKALPLSAPLAQYQLESRFGVRIDPFNHHQSMHTGLDFAAPFKSPVYNTAPGIVVFAGAKGDYGKVVDIDHGSGILTRYAHLHRITVALGQRLNAREQIGLLGSSGRSTGPHVHYEILVNGTPLDPEKFLDAGKSVIQAAVK
ncbi:MAG: peptidoglycan DD-metalloendopeptidase family protein [Alphaproteobacteria bacterium]|nr:peptidoglycan DD-metalloendopeptidase family protein [Alphaproteobacteria bacterium]